MPRLNDVGIPVDRIQQLLDQSRACIITTQEAISKSRTALARSYALLRQPVAPDSELHVGL
jgi:hypothetical protein